MAEWFPKKERALATGIFNSGTNIGAIVTPLILPIVVHYWGWRWTFVITGGVGLLWLVFWLLLYRKPEEHPRLIASGVGVYPKRSGAAGDEDAVVEIAGIPADVGVRGDASS